MSYNSAHIIQKQSYEIAVTDSQQPLQLQHELQNINLLYVLPAISNKLDELFGQDELVIIDKLELNIGTVQSGQKQESVEKILKELETSVKTLFLLKSIEEIFEDQRLNRSQHAILMWIYFLQTGALRAGAEFKSVDEVKKVILELDDISKMTLKNELIENRSSLEFVQRLALLEPVELFFFIKLFMPSTAKKEWTDFLNKINSLINAVKLKKKELQFLNVAQTQNKILASVLRIIIRAAKENKYFCFDELIIIAEENLKSIIAKREY